MGLGFPGTQDGGTPLDPDEAAGLIPRGVSTLEQLNAYEQENLLEAMAWLSTARKREVLDDEFIRELHRRMFGRTWQWSGRYRSTEKNIGVAPERIGVAVRELIANVRAQLDAAEHPLDEIAARFHHQLVSIHPFANGNGRHARLMTDLLLQRQGARAFSWGRDDLMRHGPAREAYVAALRSADARDFAPLLHFVRS